MCAWHDALTDLLVETPEVKHLSLPGGRATLSEPEANKARAVPGNEASEAYLLQAGKHEVEHVYIATSEPAI
jgi:hypothetical protein